MYQHSAPEPSPISVERHPRRTIVLAFLITSILAMAARSLLQQLEPDDGLPDPSSLSSLSAVIDALKDEELSRQHRLIASDKVWSRRGPRTWPAPAVTISLDSDFCTAGAARYGFLSGAGLHGSDCPC